MSAICATCKAEGYSTNYCDCPEKQRMDRDGLCFECAFWSLRTEIEKPTVIDGRWYAPGNRTSGSMRGMAGRRFDIEYFDGRRITTFDLWSGGEIPEVWRGQIPDNARFLNGAGGHVVGETTCWNPSNHRAPPYPLPNGQPVPEGIR